MFLFCVSVLLISSPPSVVWEYNSTGDIIAVECAGDVNNDGTEDVFAAFSESAGGGIMCLDGITGEAIWFNSSISGTFATESFRAVSDVNFDGTTDLALFLNSMSSVMAVSGATGSLLWNSTQPSPVYFIEYATGPDSCDVAVLANRVAGAELLCTFFALNGQTGEEIWSLPQQSSADFFIKTTDSDVSGNGWSEFGYSIDRGSVACSYVEVRDGFTGTLLQNSPTIYYPTVDICDSPPSMVVSHFGDIPSLWVESINTGTVNWSSDDQEMVFTNLNFIANTTGPSTPLPEILGWGGTVIYLVRGDDGYHNDKYTLPHSINSLNCFYDGTQYRLAVLTGDSFHCPPLVFNSPSVEPSINLPGSQGEDMCLLQSDLYPAPLAAVALSGTGSGVCAISTSWPLAVSGSSSTSLETTPSVRLLDMPGMNRINIEGKTDADIAVIDITGRVVRRVRIDRGQTVSVIVSPGVYMLFDTISGQSVCKATVVSN
ncbi:hypothetical protein DRQ21_07200 [Candidatus Fermentibacteria bacterium]|nr:MAG: hypothetical protein DRQ21_07200 [Candidatus Fermentibacteria bacterium]